MFQVLRRLETLVPKSDFVREVGCFLRAGHIIITSLPVLASEQCKVTGKVIGLGVYVCVCFYFVCTKNCHLDMIYLIL